MEICISEPASGVHKVLNPLKGIVMNNSATLPMRYWLALGTGHWAVARPLAAALAASCGGDAGFDLMGQSSVISTPDGVVGVSLGAGDDLVNAVDDPVRRKNRLGWHHHDHRRP